MVWSHIIMPTKSTYILLPSGTTRP